MPKKCIFTLFRPGNLLLQEKRAPDEYDPDPVAIVERSELEKRARARNEKTDFQKAPVDPSPATHAILIRTKAGECI